MLQVFIVSFSLLVALSTASSHKYLVPTITTRQETGSPPQNCNATCAALEAMEKNFTGSDGCTVTYLQAQGDCLVCQSGNATDEAGSQLLLDQEISDCHDDGIPISIKLQITPDAQDFVDKFYHDSAILKGKQKAFLALQIIGGHIGLVIVLGFSIFSHKVCRDPTYFNFCITWIFSSIVYSMLLYDGTKGHTILNPLGFMSPHMCLAQAVLINGAQTMTACSTMALVIQLWISLRTAIYGDPFKSLRHRLSITILLWVAPYVLFFAFAIPSIFTGEDRVIIDSIDLQPVVPLNFYCCIVDSRSFLRTIYGTTLGLLVITLVFDVFIVVILYRHWRAFRQIQAKGGVSLSTLLRVLLFSIYRVVVAITYGTVLDKPPGILIIVDHRLLLSSSFGGAPIWVDMLQAAIPLVAFLVLGINADMFRTLMFWRKNK